MPRSARGPPPPAAAATHGRSRRAALWAAASPGRGGSLSGGESHPGAPQGRGREPAAQGRGARPSLIAVLGRLPRSPVFSKTFQPSPLAPASQGPEPYIHLPELGGRTLSSSGAMQQEQHSWATTLKQSSRRRVSQSFGEQPSPGHALWGRFAALSAVPAMFWSYTEAAGHPFSRCPQMESLCFPTACQACAADPPTILGCCLIPAVQYLHTVRLWKIIDIKGKAVTASRDGGQGSTVAARCPARSASLPSKPEADKGGRHRGAIPLAAPRH